MPHYSCVSVIVIDVPGHDHDQELAFWQGAIGKELPRNKSYPEYHGARLPQQEQLGLLVQRLGDGQARVHLDYPHHRCGRRSGAAGEARRQTRAAGGRLVCHARPGGPAVLRHTGEARLTGRPDRPTLGLIRAARVVPGADVARGAPSTSHPSLRMSTAARG